MATMKFLGDPVDEVPDLMALVAPTGELEPMSGKPDDDLQRAAESVGRSNVSYEHIWKRIREADGKWVMVQCNSARRAILLASAALQHRTQPHNVRRRGRVVAIQFLKTAAA